MRVITGSARGRRLISPEGRDVRPTTDKVKESLFNIIQFDLPGAVVLDLFAGSGQLGIEALSRGAEKCVFVDSSRKSFDIIKQNIDLCRFSSSAVAVLSDAFTYLKTTKEKFDIILLDPPYNKQLCDAALDILGESVEDTAVVICETETDEVLPEKCGRLIIDREYVYSSIKLTVYRCVSE